MNNIGQPGGETMYVRDAGGAGLNSNNVSRERAETNARADEAHNDSAGASSRTGEQNFIANAVRFALFAVTGGAGAAAARRQPPDVRKSLDAVWEAYGLGY